MPEPHETPRTVSRAPEAAELGSVYWMESSRRRQALEWLRRGDLSADERSALEDFAARYRTLPGVAAADRRALLREFERIGRRLHAAGACPAEAVRTDPRRSSRP